MPDKNSDQRFPLTKQQQGLWIEWKLHPENTSYNTCVKVKLRGNINTEQLSQALKDIVQYFDSLKVYFVEESGVPFQYIKETGTYFLNYKDISIAGQEETPEQAQKGLDFLSATLNTPIDLKTFPIVRASLMKVADETYYFIGMVPHMISDGRSAVLFLESLSIAYNHGYQGLCDAYDATSKSWADFHDDKRNLFDLEKHSLSKKHWQQRLSGANHYFDYSYGRNAISKDDKQGHRVYFDIPYDLAKALKAHTGKNRTTLFNVMVCAFGIFIHRYFSLKDILIGFPISIRPPGYKHLFGFFVNIVPIRVDLSGDPSYQELLARVSTSRKEDKKHQKFPALDIVNAVREDLTDFDGQLFNLSMAQTVSRLFNLELEGVETLPLESEYNDVNDDLSLSYELLEDGIGLWFEYRTSMFDEDFIHQGIEHIRQILEQMTIYPERKLSEFKLLNTVQENQLLSIAKGGIQNNNPPKIKQLGSNVIQLFENQVLNTPSASALHFANKALSYSELNQAVNRLARILEAQILPQQRIAVCLNRGPSLIISLLAIMKVNACYVPIAPDYPQQRLAFIISDTQCNLIICENKTTSIAENIAINQLNIDDIKNQSNNYSSENLNTEIEAESLAYIIYTSGSTGTPKGVPISHGNLLPRLKCLQQEITLNETDVMLQNTDFSFDVSVAEIFWPLTTGASLAIVKQQESKYPEKIISIVQKYKVTVSCMVPSLLNALLLVSKDHQLDTIKHLLSAGETLSPLTVPLFYQRCSGKLYNFYGPTESTIYASFYYCEPTVSPVVPIGRPMRDTEIYILDEHQQLQAKGVAGEICIAGKSITPGYLNQPNLNKTTFINNPFNPSSSSSLYRTGDKGKLLNNGNIDFLGRMDQQVKVRGYRIEISDIEINISSINNISDCAVIVEEENDYQARLIAFYVRNKKNDDETVFSNNLKTTLLEKMPSYMLPSIFIELDEIPRGQSGKVIKYQLPSLDKRIKTSLKHVSPSTEIELKLTEIWASILKIPADKISIHDSFFELGGDSLMAIQFACAAEEKSLFFDTASLFESRTIAELSMLIQTSKPKEIIQQTIEGEYPLTARQYKFFNDNFTNPNHWNRQFSFDVEKKISVATLEKSFRQVLAHHDGLRVNFEKKKNNKWAQISIPIAQLDTSILSHDLCHLTQTNQLDKMKSLIEIAHGEIQLTKSPLIKALYFKLSKDNGSLIIISHHLLLDMVSSRIVFEDLMKCYEHNHRRIPFKLPKKTSSLKQWTEHLKSYANETSFDKAINYWGKFPNKAEPALPVNANFTADQNLEVSSKTITFELSSRITQKLLKAIPASYGYKIQDLLLVALLNLTQQWTQSPKLTVNICGHGRTSDKDDINLSRTVGWLNTVFPIKLDASGLNIQKQSEYLEKIIEQINNVPSKNMDYNILRYITKDPAITQYPEPDIFFNYVGQIDAIIPDEIAFKPSRGLQGIAEIDGNNHLCYLLYFEAGVTQEKLNIRLTYCEHAFDRLVIDNLSQGLVKEIITLVEQLTDK